MVDYYQKGVTSVLIGAVTLTKIISVEEYPDSSEGGALIIPRLVANTISPVGVTHPHKWWVCKVTIDQDDKAALDATTYLEDTAANTVVTALTITETALESAAGASVSHTITYEASKIYVNRYRNKVVTMAGMKEYQAREIEFFCYGTRTVGAWA